MQVPTPVRARAPERGGGLRRQGLRHVWLGRIMQRRHHGLRTTDLGYSLPPPLLGSAPTRTSFFPRVRPSITTVSLTSHPTAWRRADARASRAELELASAKTRALVAEKEAGSLGERCRRLESQLGQTLQELGRAQAVGEGARADVSKLEVGMGQTQRAGCRRRLPWAARMRRALQGRTTQPFDSPA